MEKQTNQLNKVARVTVFFWIMKILATTLGEVFGDYFSFSLNLGYLISLGITSAILIVVFVIQMKQVSFHAPIYWMVIVGTTTVGTEVSDLMDRTLGLGYSWGSLILFSCLLLVLFLWHKNKNGIEVYPITDRSVETYYWVAILISNSLGTAFGDYLSDSLGLSYLTGAAITAGVIVVVVLMHYFTKINHILLFWIAFIFTRPFGATFGDFLTKPTGQGGLAFSRGIAALITAAILVAVMYFSIKRENQQKQSQNGVSLL